MDLICSTDNRFCSPDTSVLECGSVSWPSSLPNQRVAAACPVFVTFDGGNSTFYSEQRVAYRFCNSQSEWETASLGDCNCTASIDDMLVTLRTVSNPSCVETDGIHHQCLSSLLKLQLAVVVIFKAAAMSGGMSHNLSACPHLRQFVWMCTSPRVWGLA